MSKQSEKKSNRGVWIILGLLFVGGAIFAVTQVGSTEFVNNNRSATTTVEVVEEVVDEAQLKKEQIRSRDDIRRQQELLVEETYLLEEKAKTQAEMKASIASYEEALQTMEEQLDAIRGEKIDFQ
jgi:predicted Zn-dependent peptidase